MQSIAQEAPSRPDAHHALHLQLDNLKKASLSMEKEEAEMVAFLLDGLLQLKEIDSLEDVLHNLNGHLEVGASIVPAKKCYLHLKCVQYLIQKARQQVCLGSNETYLELTISKEKCKHRGWK